MKKLLILIILLFTGVCFAGSQQLMLGVLARKKSAVVSYVVDIDHEVGDLTEYDSTETDSGDLSVEVGAALNSTSYGLQCVIDDTWPIYGDITLSAFATDFRARFYFDPNSLAMAQFDRFTAFQVFLSGAPWAFALVEYEARDATNILRWIKFTPYKDSDADTTDYVALSDAPHYIEFYIHRATNDSSADGTAEWWVDGVSQGTWASVDNYDIFGIINAARLGAVTGLDAGTTGTFFLDELKINDTGLAIGE